MCIGHAHSTGFYNRVFSLQVATILAPVLIGLVLAVPSASAQLGEQPAVAEHLDQAAIDAGEISLDDLFERGQLLFDARFNRLDGQGRPASTGGGAPREPDEPDFSRTSAPDSNSCSGCHAQPRSGGAGDFVANVFVLAQTLDPVTTSIDPNFSNERNTLGMMGAGPIEMLAREMSDELIAIRQAAAQQAADSGEAVTMNLVAKGVDFGTITVLPDGLVDPSGIEGVDWDLIVKPFHQKGAVVSLREFTNNAVNHHHGMQSTERFGLDVDADQDGVVNELTVGDITAVTIFQAALNTPGQVIPEQFQTEVAEGTQLFQAIGCANCHIPAMTLISPLFTEPNPYNPAGNLTPGETAQPFAFDMTLDGPKPRLESDGAGGAVVRAFTDLKRHNLNDEDYAFFDNELVPQGKLNGFAPESDFTIPAPVRPTNEFLTRKLWDVGNSPPFGHRGDLTLMSEAIYNHGGDARSARDAFFALSEDQQDRVIEFLKCLQIVPEGSDLVTIAAADDGGSGDGDGGDGGAGGAAMCGALGGMPLLMMVVGMFTLRLGFVTRRPCHRP